LTGTGVAEKFFSKFDLPTLRRRLLSDDGMGRDILFAFLHDIPGINDGSVQHQLVNLKTSGDYARIIQEVQEEIEREQREAEAALEAAQLEQERLRQEREEAPKHPAEASLFCVTDSGQHAGDGTPVPGIAPHPRPRLRGARAPEDKACFVTTTGRT
jgi:hypothetical protein